jgi:hypothetical protein
MGVFYGGAIELPVIDDTSVENLATVLDTSAGYGFKFSVETIRRIDVSYMTMYTDYVLIDNQNPNHIKGFIEALYDLINSSQQEDEPELDTTNLMASMNARLMSSGIQTVQDTMITTIGSAYKMLETNLLESGVVFIDTVIVGWEDGYGLILGEG